MTFRRYDGKTNIHDYFCTFCCFYCEAGPTSVGEPGYLNHSMELLSYCCEAPVTSDETSTEILDLELEDIDV